MVTGECEMYYPLFSFNSYQSHDVPPCVGKYCVLSVVCHRLSSEGGQPILEVSCSVDSIFSVSTSIFSVSRCTCNYIVLCKTLWAVLLAFLTRSLSLNVSGAVLSNPFLAASAAAATVPNLGLLGAGNMLQGWCFKQDLCIFISNLMLVECVPGNPPPLKI